MQEVGPAERARLLERFGRSFAAGAAIYAEGEAADRCFLLHEGRVRLVKRIRGTDRSLTLLKAGDLFGEDALVPNLPRTASAVALTDVRVLALDRATFGSLLASHGEVAARLVEQLVKRLRSAEEQLENALLRDAPSRVVNTLLKLAQGTPAGPDGHVLHVSPLELSARVGLDVEAVKKAVQQLRDGGYLQLEGERVVVPDGEALRQLFELLGAKEEIRGGAEGPQSTR